MDKLLEWAIGYENPWFWNIPSNVSIRYFHAHKCSRNLDQKATEFIK